MELWNLRSWRLLLGGPKCQSSHGQRSKDPISPVFDDPSGTSSELMVSLLLWIYDMHTLKMRMQNAACSSSKTCSRPRRRLPRRWFRMTRRRRLLCQQAPNERASPQTMRIDSVCTAGNTSFAILATEVIPNVTHTRQDTCSQREKDQEVYEPQSPALGSIT